MYKNREKNRNLFVKKNQSCGQKITKSDRIGNILKTIDNRNYFRDFKNSLENILNNYNKEIKKKNLFINRKVYKGLSQKIKKPKNFVMNIKKKTKKINLKKDNKMSILNSRSKSSKLFGKMKKKTLAKKCKSLKKFIPKVQKTNKKKFASFANETFLSKKFHLKSNNAVKNKNNLIYNSLFNSGKKMSDLKMNFFKVIKKNRELSHKLKKENSKKIIKSKKKSLKKVKTLSKFITSQKKEEFNFNFKTPTPKTKTKTKKTPIQNPQKPTKKKKYYITSQKQSLTLTKAPTPYQKQYILQFNQTIQSFQFLKKLNLKNYSPNGKKITLTPTSKKTLIFDLDETLIHCNEDQNTKSDIQIPIIFPTGEKISAGINIRPFAIEILEEMSEFFEIIIFTASHYCYANPVIDFLDKKKVVSRRLFRDHCSQIAPGLFTKDLRVMQGRDLCNVILVDNAAYSFLPQVFNGVPILPYYRGKKDRELFRLKEFLIGIKDCVDVRECIRKHFKWDLYLENGPADVIKKI